MSSNDIKLRPVKCTFCSNEVVVDEAGWLGQTDDFEMKMKNAKCALANKEWEHARLLYESCLAINETDARSYRGVIESLYHCYINLAGKLTRVFVCWF